LTNQPASPPDEFTEWQQHPMTERFFNFLKLLRESAKEDWAREQFIGDGLEDWALRNAKALGGVTALHELSKVTLEDIIDAEKEAHESVRN
jgi:hypothetical protein